MTGTLRGFVYFHLKLTPQRGSMFISALQMKDLSSRKGSCPVCLVDMPCKPLADSGGPTAASVWQRHSW